MTPSLLNSAQVGSLLKAAAPGAPVYLIGAGGCGMSGLGHLLADLGFKVAGADLAINEEIRQLIARGVQVQQGHSGGQIEAAQPILVVFSSAVSPGNPEFAAAVRLGIPLARRGAVLAALAGWQRGICVAGMHGKTTTASLLAYALEQLGQKPSYAIGSVVPQFPRHARWSPSPETVTAHAADKWFVVEADESDGTLQEFRPTGAILLNIDEEHLDYYANFDSIRREFGLFLQRVQELVVFCADDPELAVLLKDNAKAISYGFSESADYRIVGLRPKRDGDPGSVFGIRHQGSAIGEFSIVLLGEKNVSNAAAVIALLHQMGFPPPQIAEAIHSFRGAARRQHELYSDRKVRVFEDYGHHPNEIRATLQALRQLAPRRLLVAFQPHRYSRTQSLLTQFASCFREADGLWLTEIYAASEKPITGVSGLALADAVRARGQQCEFVPALEQLSGTISAALQPGDLVLFLGAGDITKEAHRFAASRSEAAAQTRAALYQKLTDALSGDSVVRRDERLAKRTTMRVGGKADFYVEPVSEQDLALVLRFCSAHRLPFMILGRGSNLLVKDGGFRGVVLCLGQPAFSRIEVRGEELHCGAGAKLKAVAAEAKRQSLAGLEFLDGIPGSVGGALRMNAGAMGGSMFGAVVSLRFMDFEGNVYERRADEVETHYRRCPLLKNHIALGAILKGQAAPREEIASRMNACNRKRWESQPAAPSAGCIFKNPTTVPAGRLIEELGLKGARIGGAKVSEVHGNFIVNESNATAHDVLALIDMIKQRAKALRNIDLETEVEIVGENAECEVRSAD